MSAAKEEKTPPKVTEEGTKNRQHEHTAALAKCQNDSVYRVAL